MMWYFIQTCKWTINSLKSSGIVIENAKIKLFLLFFMIFYVDATVFKVIIMDLSAILDYL